MAKFLTEWMETLTGPQLLRSGQSGGWQPAADVYRSPAEWLVKFDLAGVRPEDVEVRVDGPRLTVSGCRRDQTCTHGMSFYRMEISYNSFQRTIELPCNIDAARISTEMRDGMLLIHVHTT